MTGDEFLGLNCGDIVRHVLSGDSYVVTSNYGDRVTCCRTIDLTNPQEWRLALKAHYRVTEYDRS